MYQPATASLERNLDAFFSDFGRLPGSRIEDRGDLVWYRSASRLGVWNGVVRARLDEARADARISEIVESFAADGWPFQWHAGPSSRPGDLGARLVRHGFDAPPPAPGMSLVIARAPLAEPLPRDFEVRRVSTRDEVRVWLDVLSEGYGIPKAVVEADAFRVGCEAQALGEASPMVYHLGLLEGRPVATGQTLPDGAFVGIYGVSTVPDARRRGLGRALTLALLREAAAGGCAEAVLASSEMAESMYARLGFEVICPVHKYVWSPR